MVDRCASASQRLLWYANRITHLANAPRLDDAHPGIPLIGVASTSDVGPDKVSLFSLGKYSEQRSCESSKSWKNLKNLRSFVDYQLVKLI